MYMYVYIYIYVCMCIGAIHTHTRSTAQLGHAICIACEVSADAGNDAEMKQGHVLSYRADRSEGICESVSSERPCSNDAQASGAKFDKRLRKFQDSEVPTC